MLLAVAGLAAAGCGSGTTVDKITKVMHVSGGNQVTATHTFNGATTTETFLSGSDGPIALPLTSIGSTTVHVKSGGIALPSQTVIDSGQPTASTIVLVASIAGQSHTLTAHVPVRGLGPASVTAPAGTYHATVVQQTMSEPVAGISVKIAIRTWLAPGVGPVKSQVTTNGTVAAGQDPTSFTKGLGLNGIVAFWSAYILTRPLGASLADWASVPHWRGGLGFGWGPVSLVLTAIIIGMVGYLAASGKDTRPAAGPVRPGGSHANPSPAYPSPAYGSPAYAGQPYRGQAHQLSAPPSHLPSPRQGRPSRPPRGGRHRAPRS